MELVAAGAHSPHFCFFKKSPGLRQEHRDPTCSGDAMCFNMYYREIKLREACCLPRLTEMMPANLLNSKNIMQHKRNLSNSKAFTQ